MGLRLIKKAGHFLLVLASACLGISCLSFAQSGDKWNVDSVLDRMDAGARDFRTLTANIEHIKYTEVVKDTSTEAGQMWLQRKDEKMRIEFAKPDQRTILRSGDTLAIYNPKINRVEEYDLGKDRALVDQYVRLGFGTRSEDLKKSFRSEERRVGKER